MVSPGHGEAPECETCHQRGDGPLLDEAHGAARRHHRAERVAEVVSGHPGLLSLWKQKEDVSHFYHRLEENWGTGDGDIHLSDIFSSFL